MESSRNLQGFATELRREKDVTKLKSQELVALVDASKYTKLTDAVARALELIAFNPKKEVKKIAIKPNLCNYWKSTTGETTDPHLVEAIIDNLRKKCKVDEVLIVESDATAVRAKHAFRALGYEKLARRKKVKLLNLCEDDSVSAPHVPPTLSPEIRIPKTLAEVDLFISVPKLKFHSITALTCALKNQFGCIPIKRKIVFHKRLHETIALINKLIPPDLIVVDGIIAGGKNPKRLNLIMASSDAVAVDCAAATIAGLRAERIKHITKSEKIGVGSMNFECVGDNIQSFAKEFPRKGFVSRFSRKALLKSYAFYLRFFTLEGRVFKKQPTLGG
jgi:uncharacterized protein (DUF362 family)